MDLKEEKGTTLFKIMSLIIIDALGVEKTKIAFDSRFEDDLGADSLDLYELLYQFEATLSVSISDEEAAAVFKTIGSLYLFLQPNCAWIDNPKSAEDYAKRGNAYSSKYFALLNYETALEIDENCINALLGRAKLYEEENSFENAIKDISKILEISPNHPYMFCMRGNCYLGSADSQQFLNTKGDNDPTLGMDFRYNIDDTLKKALADFNNAIKANGKDFDAVLGRAKTYYRMGKYEEAVKDFKNAIKNSSVTEESPEMLGLIEKGYIIFDEEE